MAQDDLENDIEEFDNQEDEETSDISGEEEVDSNNGVQKILVLKPTSAQKEMLALPLAFTPTHLTCDVRLLPPLETKHFAQTLPLSLTFNTI